MNDNTSLVKKGVKKKRKRKQNIPDDIFIDSDDSIPDKILIKYKDEIDLNIINQAVINKYEKLSNEKNLNIILNDIKKLKITKCKDYHNKKFLQKKIKEKTIYYNNLKNNHYINKYKNEIKNLSIGKTKIENCQEYIRIVKNYINIDILEIKEKKINCINCNFSMENCIEDNDGFYLCQNCNTYNPVLKPNKYEKDVETYFINNEEDINNFIKIIDKFEGKNTIQIEENLINDLDKYFKNIGLHEGKYYKNLKPLENGKKEGTSKRLLLEGLEFLGKNKYYDEINYLCNIYWGWKIPDLSEYREQIIKDYQLSQNVWYTIRDDYNRSASLGTQYRLYVHLLAVGYPCEREDFKIQDMINSLRLHNHAWKRMCEKCDIKYFEVSS